MKKNQPLTKIRDTIGQSFISFAALAICCMLMSSCSKKMFLPKVNTSNARIQNMRGKSSVEIPTAYELVNVIIALTKYGKDNPGVIDTGTAYYKRVLAHFAAYGNHAAVKTIGKIIPQKPFGQSGIHWFSLRQSSINYEIDSNGNLVNTGMYNFKKLPLILQTRKIVAELNDFSKASHFLQFYESEQKYYDSLIAVQKARGDYDKIIKWLSDNFTVNYKSHRIITSPLMGSTHFTIPFYRIHQYEQALIFISPPGKPGNKDYLSTSAVMGIFLTEIDENYAGAICNATYKNIIEQSMTDARNWSRMGKGMYDTKVSAFTEMFTHALFVLYCYEQFSAAEFAAIKENKENRMVNYRKFIHFKDFDNALLQLYINKKTAGRIEDLIPAIANWMKQQNL